MRNPFRSVSDEIRRPFEGVAEHVLVVAPALVTDVRDPAPAH